MATYELRYFFDYGSGICLWSSNEAARTRFGYPVRLDDLALPRDIEELASKLLDRFDMSLNWDDPAGPLVWSIQDRDRFSAKSEMLLQLLRDHLGEDFHIIGERKID
jgi:hypothetical protein